MTELEMVWIVTRWEWGGGGDDSTEIVGVYATAEDAYAVALGEDQVAAHEVKRRARVSHRGSTDPENGSAA